MYCSKCGKEIDDGALWCKHCCAQVAESPLPAQPSVVQTKSPGIAAVLSFFIPGLGQIYNGQIGWGFTAMVFTPVLVLISIVLVPRSLLYLLAPFGWWFIIVSEAYQYAEKKNELDAGRSTV